MAQMRTVTILPDGNIRDSQPSWSVTNKIAFVRTDTETYASDIYVVNLDGSGLLNISNTPSFDEADPTGHPMAPQSPIRATPTATQRSP